MPNPRLLTNHSPEQLHLNAVRHCPGMQPERRNVVVSSRNTTPNPQQGRNRRPGTSLLLALYRQLHPGMLQHWQPRLVHYQEETAAFPRVRTCPARTAISVGPSAASRSFPKGFPIVTQELCEAERPRPAMYPIRPYSYQQTCFGRQHLTLYMTWSYTYICLCCLLYPQ